MTIAATDEAVHVRAPGKVNLFLRVGDVQSDGYHDVATAYQAVSLYEDVRAWPDDEFSVVFNGSIDTSGLPADASNLAIRAAKLLARTAGVPGGVHLEIDKHVPIAGGMGGGSADAAATLVACDAMWGTTLSKEELHALAAKLGADVPFALTGGTAIGTGRGDRLSPALATGSFHWVLAVAEFGLSTPGVYRELDRRRGEGLRLASVDTTPTVDASVLQALRAGDPRLLADAQEEVDLAWRPNVHCLVGRGDRHDSTLSQALRRHGLTLRVRPGRSRGSRRHAAAPRASRDRCPPW